MGVQVASCLPDWCSRMSKSKFPLPLWSSSGFSLSDQSFSGFLHLALVGILVCLFCDAQHEVSIKASHLCLFT